MRIRAIKSNLIQFSWVSWCRVSLNKRLISRSDWISLLPLIIGGLQTECKVQNMPRALIIPLVTWDTKAGPLSLSRDPTGPNLGISSFSSASATSAVISVLVGNASIHLKNMSTSTRRYLKLPMLSEWQCNQFASPLRICPSGVNGPYVGFSHVGVVTFHAKSYHDLN